MIEARILWWAVSNGNSRGIQIKLNKIVGVLRYYKKSGSIGWLICFRKPRIEIFIPVQVRQRFYKAYPELYNPLDELPF